MKILLVHNFYRSPGGEDIAALAEKHLLEAHGHDVLFYTRNNQETDSYPWSARLGLPLSTIYSRRTHREVRSLVRQFQPDLAYIQNFFPLISPAIYHTLHGLQVPIVQVVHDWRFLCPNGLFYTEGQICERCKWGNYLHAVRHRCYKNSYAASGIASAVIGMNRLAGILDKVSAFACLTEFAKQKFAEIGIPAEKLFVKPHSINVADTKPQPGSGDYVLYLGRLSPEKGLWTLARAFGQLRETPLKIVGTGPLEAELRRYVQEQRLQNVDIVGFKAGQEKWALIQNSVCVIVPSEWYETFGLVVLEAYAAGKPVIGSNVGSLPFVIEDGKSGLLFRAGDSDDLRDKVRQLLTHPQDAARMGMHGRNLVESRYVPAVVYQGLMDIFSTVLSRGSVG